MYNVNVHDPCQLYGSMNSLCLYSDTTELQVEYNRTQRNNRRVEVNTEKIR